MFMTEIKTGLNKSATIQAEKYNVYKREISYY
jgi:hypothetical protein